MRVTECPAYRRLRVACECASERQVAPVGLAKFEGRSSLVVTMRDVLGMPTEQVCAALGVSPAYQRVLLHRARAVLRTALAGYHGG